MTLTSQVKEELADVADGAESAALAEIAAAFRFAGDLRRMTNRVALEAELDSAIVAQRLSRMVRNLFNLDSSTVSIVASGIRNNERYVVRICPGGEQVARRTGLIDRAGRAVVGLPPRIIGGTVEDCEAAWRGAFLANGDITEPGRSGCLEVAAPCPEAALALVGCARRLGITAKVRENRGGDRVQVRDAEAIGALLTRMGAHRTRLLWQEQHAKKEVRATANRLANFDDANLRRSAKAAVVAAARVSRALEILGDDVPEQLVTAGQLRVQHRQASLEELGQLASPQMTKDAVAGRIRRLLSMADKRAGELGIPDTNAAVTDSLFEEADIPQ